jgi:hypothetical protein
MTSNFICPEGFIKCPSDSIFRYNNTSNVHQCVRDARLCGFPYQTVEDKTICLYNDSMIAASNRDCDYDVRDVRDVPLKRIRAKLGKKYRSKHSRLKKKKQCVLFLRKSSKNKVIKM